MEWSVVGVLGLFLTGLALNLTPCVYPMLSITVSLFGGREEKRFGPTFLKALFYVAGMASMYSSLGVAAAFAGKFFGAFLQSPLVLGAISVLMFALALSMFGLYGFQLPIAALNRVGGMRRAGHLGVFLSGLCVGIFAAPCIGPPIVALLAIVGQKENPISGFFIFFILSLGLGLPYLILGTFSGLLSRLPKSGEWMVWVKKSFGVVLIGFSVFYAILALGAGRLLPLVIPIILIGGGIFLGFFESSGNRNTAFRRLKQTAGTAAVLLGFSFFLFQPRQRVVWEPYSAEKITLAAQAGKPVVIDFFADWCIPCHELDQFTYSDKKVIQALEPFVRLKADVTNPKTKAALEPIERFEVVGVPTVLFLDSNSREVTSARITGFVPPDDFLEALRMVDVNAESGEGSS